MNRLLRDFCQHQSWADAEHWRAIEAHPPAAEGAAIKKPAAPHTPWSSTGSSAVGDRAVGFAATTPEAFASLAELKRYGRGATDDIVRFLEQVTDARLDELIEMPRTNPPLSITVTEALTKSAMHSHYHRGQNATRLRELGGEPPLTDLIVWC